MGGYFEVVWRYALVDCMVLHSIVLTKDPTVHVKKQTAYQELQLVKNKTKSIIYRIRMKVWFSIHKNLNWEVSELLKDYGNLQMTREKWLTNY